MVVTASRLHALHYKRALDRYCNDHGIGDVRTLVAFSGSSAADGEELTESKVNGFPDSQAPTQFDTDAWQILVVAEKYQTGFDQPKLYAMYVDKTLTGLAAVQTLSRLNRTMDGKTGTFVLDFRNTADDIQASGNNVGRAAVAVPTKIGLGWHVLNIQVADFVGYRFIGDPCCTISRRVTHSVSQKSGEDIGVAQTCSGQGVYEQSSFPIDLLSLDAESIRIANELPVDSRLYGVDRSDYEVDLCYVGSQILGGCNSLTTRQVVLGTCPLDQQRASTCDHCRYHRQGSD